MNTKHLLLILAITILLTQSEAKRPRKKLKKPSVLSSFFRRAPRTKQKETDESKRVFYYSLPETTQRPPRIILGDELDFTQLGIQNGPKQKQLRIPLTHSHSSLSNLEQQPYSYDNYGDDDDIPVPHPPPPRGPKFQRRPKHNKRPRGKRPRGPGYRLERPWNEHYVIEQEQDYEPQRPNNYPAVMPYLKNAGRNIVGAYRAAMLQSAKVAHFTGHAASTYIKGVRNLVARNDNSRSDLKQTEPEREPEPQQKDALVLRQELPPNVTKDDIVEIDLSKNPEADASGSLPKVYLDWGGSFWRFFYNKNNDIPANDGLHDGGR